MQAAFGHSADRAHNSVKELKAGTGSRAAVDDEVMLNVLRCQLTY